MLGGVSTEMKVLSACVHLASREHTVKMTLISQNQPLQTMLMSPIRHPKLFAGEVINRSSFSCLGDNTFSL